LLCIEQLVKLKLQYQAVIAIKLHFTNVILSYHTVP